MSAFKIQFDPERYRIVAPDGTGGDPVPYGDVAEVEYRGKTYISIVDLPEGDEGLESVLGEDWVYMLTPQHADEENVEFEDPDATDLDVTEEVSGDGEVDVDEDEDEDPAAA